MTKVMLGADTQMTWATEGGTYKAGMTGTQQWFGYMTEDGAHAPDESEGYEFIRYIGGGNRNVDTILLGPTEYTGTIRVDKLQEITMAPYAFGKLAQAGSPTSTRTKMHRMQWRVHISGGNTQE